MAQDTLSERAPDTHHSACHMQSVSHLFVLTNCLLVQKDYMRSHILIIAWFDHNFWKEILSASVSLIGGKCQKKVVMSKSCFARRDGNTSSREYLQFEYFNHTTICPSTSLIEGRINIEIVNNL